MKRFLSVLLCTVIVMTVFLPVSGADKKWKLGYTTIEELERDADVVARFVVGSDVHIGYSYSSQKLQNAYDVIGKMGGADAFILAGDLTEQGTHAEYAELMRIVNANSGELTVDVEGYDGKGVGDTAPVDTTVLVLGNHEYYDIGGEEKAHVTKRFKEKTGQEIDKLYWIAGKVPVIKLGMDLSEAGKAYYSKHEFLENALAEVERSGWKGHIFLVTHVECGDSDSITRETRELLKKYPQLVNVWGHTHMNPYSPYFIDQSAGYTTINDGVVGKDFGNGGEYGSTGVIFDVKKNGETRFYRVDFHNGRIIFPHEAWVLDSSDTPEDFIYVDDGRESSYFNGASAPYFDTDAELKVRDLGDNDRIEVTFSKAKTKTNNNYDYIGGYYVEAYPVDGEGRVLGEWLRHPDHIPGNMEADELSVVVRGLDWNEDYRVRVYAESSYGYESGVITSEKTVNVGSRDLMDDPVLLYDIDYSDGDGKDKMGHDSKVQSFIKIKYDELIGMQAAHFIGLSCNSYAFREEDYEAMREEFTVETYVYLDNHIEKQEIVGNLSTGGLAIGVSMGKAYVIMDTGYESEGNTCEGNVAPKRWVHITATYDSKDVRLYIDGKLVDTTRVSGGLNVDGNDISEENRYFNVGARDMTGEFSYRLSNGSKVHSVKMYKGAKTAEAVKSSYIDTVGIPFTDVKSTDWFHSSVRYAYSTGLMNGTSETTFSPKTVTTRAMLVRMLYNLEGMPDAEYRDVFSDVENTSWYADAVMWAYENGVTTGTSATTFSPNAPVTREQVAVFLYRYMKNYKKADMMKGADLSVYPDAGKISPYKDFAESVAWANAAGIIGGKKAGDTVTLSPLDKAQRSETAAMFTRLHRSFVQ